MDRPGSSVGSMLHAIIEKWIETLEFRGRVCPKCGELEHQMTLTIGSIEEGDVDIEYYNCKNCEEQIVDP